MSSGENERISSEDTSAGPFEPFRETVQSVMERSLSSCGETDRKRAADRMGRLIGGKPAMSGDAKSVATLIDLAMFEPNDRGVRPIDRFISGSSGRLSAAEQEMARRLGTAFFSFFTVIGEHDEGGAWVEDILHGNRRLWIADLKITGPKAAGQTLAVRIFDVGPFHATLSPLSSVSEKMIDICRKAIETDGTLPFRRSLAAIVYGADYIGETGVPNHPSGKKFAAELYDALVRTGELPVSRLRST
jgi:hypothetical protein